MNELKSNTSAITVKVSFVGYLKQYTGHKEPQQINLPMDSVAEDAIKFFEIPLKLIKIVNINGFQSQLTTVLNHGDEIILQPVLLGG